MTATLTHERQPRTGMSGPEVIMFVAEGCQPCVRMLDLVNEALASKAVPVRVIDVWDDPQAAVDHEIMSVPAVVVTSGATEVARISGATSRRRVFRKLRAAMVAATQGSSG